MAIIGREFRLEDISGINEIYLKCPSLGVPNLNNVIINSTFVDEETGKIVGYGVVKVFAEAILIIDPDLRKREKGIVLREGMKTAIVYSKDAGVDILYALSSNENFSQVLRNQYGFKECPETLLMLELDKKG